MEEDGGLGFEWNTNEVTCCSIRVPHVSGVVVELVWRRFVSDRCLFIFLVRCVTLSWRITRPRHPCRREGANTRYQSDLCHPSLQQSTAGCWQLHLYPVGHIPIYREKKLCLFETNQRIFTLVGAFSFSDLLRAALLLFQVASLYVGFSSFSLNRFSSRDEVLQDDVDDVAADTGVAGEPLDLGRRRQHLR